MGTHVNNDELADRLHSVALHLLRLVRQEDTATGISPARLSALSVLVFGGPRTVGELAAAEQVRSPTMTRLVQGLERDGLVRRRAHPSDRRAVRVEATGKGTRLLHLARARRVANLAERLQGLDREQRAAVLRAVGILEPIARA